MATAADGNASASQARARPPKAHVAFGTRLRKWPPARQHQSEAHAPRDTDRSLGRAHKQDRRVRLLYRMRQQFVLAIDLEAKVLASVIGALGMEESPAATAGLPPECHAALRSLCQTHRTRICEMPPTADVKGVVGSSIADRFRRCCADRPEDDTGTSRSDCGQRAVRDIPRASIAAYMPPEPITSTSVSACIVSGWHELSS
jgi:hypothetical protein